MEAAIANLKEGKSEVVCEGQLYEIAKGKQPDIVVGDNESEIQTFTDSFNVFVGPVSEIRVP